MPFLGLDWRAPGQNWVRTHTGWEKLIALREDLNKHIQKLVKHRLTLLNDKQTSQSSDRAEKLFLLTSDRKTVNEVDNNNCMKMENKNGNINDRRVEQKEFNRQLYLVIPKGRSGLHRTINMSEVMTKLDFGVVARDTRMFNYVCRCLELTISEHFKDVHGTSQKHVFNVIGQIVHHVSETTVNVKRIKTILTLLEKSLKENKFTHVGSSKVWEKKLKTVEKWKEELDTLELPKREEDGQLQLLDLPDDCLRYILDRINDHRDLVNLGATNYKLNIMCKDENLWKNLCSFYFTEKQVWSALPNFEDDVIWLEAYKKLNKKHEKREYYAQELQLCNRCHSVFWGCTGHPCPVTAHKDDQNEFKHLEGSRDVSPQEFIKILFTGLMLPNFQR